VALLKVRHVIELPLQRVDPTVQLLRRRLGVAVQLGLTRSGLLLEARGVGLLLCAKGLEGGLYAFARV
jgi:hypothetical protein